MKINFGNSNRLIMEGVNTEGWEFKPLRDYLGKEVPIKGFFTTLGKWGEQVVVVSDGVLVNMPKRSVNEFNIIKDNHDYVDALMAGRMKLTNIHMQEFKNGDGVAYDVEISD